MHATEAPSTSGGSVPESTSSPAVRCAKRLQRRPQARLAQFHASLGNDRFHDRLEIRESNSVLRIPRLGLSAPLVDDAAEGMQRKGAESELLLG